MNGVEVLSWKGMEHAGAAFSNPRMSLKLAGAEKGRVQGENLLSERIEGLREGRGARGRGKLSTVLAAVGEFC